MRKMTVILVLFAIFLSGCSPKKDLALKIPGSRLQIVMKLIPAGNYVMGSPSTEHDRWMYWEGPQHQVTITEPFYMGVYEVTQEQWEAVMGNNPSWFDDSPKNPVEQVSWEDCQKFLAKINTKGIGTFRLPTEAEWEYACRAGSTTRFPWGDDPDYSKTGEYAWHTLNSSESTHQVGEKRPNAWGLFDMNGNVCEWCNDWFSDEYGTDLQTDPKGPATGFSRVIRGGFWGSYPRNCRSADRGGSLPSNTYSSQGFRLVRTAQ